MAARIDVSGVRYRYPGTKWILDGVDLTMAQGEYALVFGASGSGKSTLGYLLNGLIPHFFGGVFEGKVTVAGIDTRYSSVNELFHRVGLVIQNADAQLFNSTAENEIAFGLESLNLCPADIEKRISEVSAQLNIENLLNRKPETLSGGEKRLVSIAAVLSLRPSVIVLDEPYSNIDAGGIRRIRNLLREIREGGGNVIVIEHRAGRFLQDATHCAVIENGRISFQGERRNKRGMQVIGGLLPRYPQKPERNAPGAGDAVLEIEKLSCIVNGKKILDGVSLAFQRNETVAVIGDNGAGKTTLIRHFNRLIRPAEGRVFLEGHDINRKTPAELARRIGVCFQNPNDQFFKSDVRSELMAGPRALNRDDSAGMDRICRLLGLDGLMTRSPHRLSEGEKTRVAIGSILAMGPDILVLDEPTTGQDGRFKETIAKIVLDLASSGVTIIIVTHDIDFAKAVADRYILLDGGRVAADGLARDMPDAPA